MKKNVHCKRRQFQRARKRGIEQEINKHKENYYRTRKEYDRKIKETRSKSWKEFINTAAGEPWGFAYKLSCNKLRGQTVLNSIATQQEHATDWRESAGYLLDELFGEDLEESDTPEQETCRSETDHIDITPPDKLKPFTRKELDKVIQKMKTGKAPGWDSIEV